MSANNITMRRNSINYETNHVLMTHYLIIDLNDETSDVNVHSRGILDYSNEHGVYVKRVYDLKQNTKYRWKVTTKINRHENYSSTFMTNEIGAVRLIIVPHQTIPKLLYDHNVIDWIFFNDNPIKKIPYLSDNKPSSSHDPKTINGHQVFVHLFEWKWNDIADECERFLAPKGYGAIQISPPNEHALFPNLPWWQRYQPVSYALQSRSGTEQEFTNMVQKCNALGVRIYVDAVINHMSSAIGKGSAGSYFNYESLEYPGVPFGPDDFNDSLAHSSSGNIETYLDMIQVRNCRLNGLPDLATGREEVRQKIIDYLNRLIEIGVAGFRIDASKHMFPEDIKAIVDGLIDLREDIFGRRKRPFIYQEVIDMGGEPIDYREYTPIGRVTEFRYGMHLSHIVDRRFGQKLSYLRNFGSDWNFLNGNDAVAFVDNHDNQRGHGGGGQILNFFTGKRYIIANAFMLAWPYGCVQVMSSYNYNKQDHDQGPPCDTDGHTFSVQINKDGSSTNGWMCEHRWRQIANMVEFRNLSAYEPVSNWWDNNSNQIAFSRGSVGFIAINNDDFNMDIELQTGLPGGIYCDIMSDSRLIHVKKDGIALIFISHQTDEPIIAIHINSKMK